MVYPKTIEQMYALLHYFQMVCMATGLASMSSLGPFLDDVVYQPLLAGAISWPVAFELLLLYLRMIESEPQEWNITNVFSKSGGMDSKRKEATEAASNHFPASFFRTLRGDPRERGPGADIKQDDKDKKHIGAVNLFNETGNRGCTAWNSGRPHLAKHVDANGRCKFVHGCDQYVTDKGPGGQCLDRQHKRDQCTYDAALKCSVPSKQ